MNIPRANSIKVKSILERTDLDNRQKAIEIHNFDWDMAQRETDGVVKRWNLMSVSDIEKELNKNQV